MPPDQKTTPAESENIQADKQNPSPENTTPSDTPETAPDAQNAPADGFSAESNNSAINKGDTETSQPENEPQTPENQDSSSGEAEADKENEPVSELSTDAEAKADKETAQTPVNEPLAESEPSVSEAKEELKPIETPEPEPEKEKPRTSYLKSQKWGELLVIARNAMQFRKRKKLDKIMSLFLQKSRVTNDEVEKFLHVSDATATRYLSQLEKEGKIKQNGKTGAGVSYSRI